MSRLRLDVNPDRLIVEGADGFSFEYRRRDSLKVIVLAAAWLALGMTVGHQLADSSHELAEREGLAAVHQQAAVLERQQRAGRDQQELLALFHRWLGYALEGRSSYPAQPRDAP